MESASGRSGTTTEPLPATTTTVEAVTTSAPPSATTTTLAAGPPLPLRTPVRRCTPAVAAADVRRWAEYTVEWTYGYVESASGWIGPGAGHYAIRSPRGWDNWFWLSPMSSYSTELQCT